MEMNHYGKFIRYKKRWIALRWVSKMFFWIEGILHWLADKCEWILKKSSMLMENIALWIADFSSEREPD
jgi:hypothetical protein